MAVDDRETPPWHLWETLSAKAEALDTIDTDCGHTFYWPPYTIDFLIKSKISLRDNTCNDKNCRAIDEYLFECDIEHIPRFQPKPIRAVNRNICLVLSRDGILQGPYQHFQWLEYSWFLWDQFHDVLDNHIELSEQKSQELWASLYFRDPEFFIGGNYNFFSEIHLLLANSFPDLNSKHKAYSEVHAGADLWTNLYPTDIKDAKQFRNTGKIFNVSVPHESNCRIRGIPNLSHFDVLAQRAKRKEQLDSLRNRMKSKTENLSSMIPDNCDHMEAWYPATKALPLRLNGRQVVAAVYPNNQRHIDTHWNTVIKCLTDFLKNGAIKLMPQSYIPPMSCSLVLANADNPLKKVRPCHDGGALKLLEAFKAPCKLEGLPEILKILKQNDFMSKLDDSKGFHLLKLHPESRDLCNFEFAGRIFQYYVLPFGERKSPSSFQQANLLPLNYCRMRGLTVSLYLDDRLVVEPFFDRISKSYSPLRAKNTFLVCSLIIASGGFINLAKSVFKPTQKEEFLGFDLDTTTATISIPPVKWQRFQESLDFWLNKQTISLHELEILRGQMCSFLISSKYLKMFIRRQTELIKGVYASHKGENHFFFKNEQIQITERLKEEWREWRHATTLEVSRCWLPPKEQNKQVVTLHTDASLAQLGGVLFVGDKCVGEFKMPFSVDISHWSIAAKEMLAIFYSMLHFARYLIDKYIILYCDNQQACFGFSLDGSRNATVNDLLVKIYRVLFLLKAELKCYWIPTFLQIGDKPSREVDLSEEFLPKPIFDRIIHEAGFVCDVDVMASISNFKCAQFIVRCNNGIPHPGIIGYDFLNFDFSKLDNKNIFVFPPKVLIEQVAAVLSKYFIQHNFVLVFHQWYELPLGVGALLGIPSTRIVTLSTDEAISFIPSEEMRTMPYFDQIGDYKFNGSPNIKPRSTRMIVNNPNSRKRKNH